MKLIVTIEMDNSAFEPENGTEAARILKNVAGFVEFEQLSEFSSGRAHDLNGNPVCVWSVTE